MACKDIKWESVFSKREIQKHLDDKDLKEAGLISKPMRSELKPFIFEKLSVDENIVELVSRLPNIDMANFSDNLKFVESVYVTCQIREFEFRNLLNYFNNVRKIHLSSITLEPALFNNIFEGLPNLKQLELNKVKIFVRLPLIFNTTDCALHVPLALNKLVLKSCSCFVDSENIPFCSESEDNLKKRDYYPFKNIPNLKLQNLTSLTILDTFSSDYKYIYNFLINNPKLKGLSLEYTGFDKEAWRSILNLNSLNHLSLSKCVNVFHFKVDTLSHSVKSLILDESAYRTSLAFLSDLAKTFPNINYLKLAYKANQIRFIQKLIPQLCKLNRLELTAPEPQNDFKVVLKNKNIAKLNLDKFNIKELDLKLLANKSRLKNLKTLTLSNHTAFEEVNKNEIIENNLKIGWNTIFIGSNIVCSKDRLL